MKLWDNFGLAAIILFGSVTIAPGQEVETPIAREMEEPLDLAKLTKISIFGDWEDREIMLRPGTELIAPIPFLSLPPSPDWIETATFEVERMEGFWLKVNVSAYPARRDNDPTSYFGGWVHVANVLPIETAAETLTKQIEAKPEARLFHLRSYVHLRHGDLPECIDDLTEAIRLQPKNTQSISWQRQAEASEQDDEPNVTKMSRECSPRPAHSNSSNLRAPDSYRA